MTGAEQWGGRTAEQRGDLGSPASTSGQSLESPGSPFRPGSPSRFSVQTSSPSLRSLLKSQSLRPRLAEQPPPEEDRPPAGALQVIVIASADRRQPNEASHCWVHTNSHMYLNTTCGLKNTLQANSGTQVPAFSLYKPTLQVRCSLQV